MKNDQPALLQKYIKLNDHRVELLSMVNQDRGSAWVTPFPSLAIKIRSASLSRGSSCGLFRNCLANPNSQIAPRIPINAKPTRHPKGNARSAISTGAIAPPQRANIQISPWVKPRSWNGNHSRQARVMFGNAPASPAPKQKRKATREIRLQ